MKERQQAEQEEETSSSGSESDSELDSHGATSRSPTFRASASPRASPSRTGFDEMARQDKVSTSPKIQVVSGDPEAAQVQIWRHAPPSGRRLPLPGACPSNRHTPTHEMSETKSRSQQSPAERLAPHCDQKSQQQSRHRATLNGASCPESCGGAFNLSANPTFPSPVRASNETTRLSKGSSASSLQARAASPLAGITQEPTLSSPAHAHGQFGTATTHEHGHATICGTIDRPLETGTHSIVPGHISRSPSRPGTSNERKLAVAPVLSDQRASIAAARAHARECLLRHSLVSCVSDLPSNSPCPASPCPPQPESVTGGLPVACPRQNPPAQHTYFQAATCKEAVVSSSRAVDAATQHSSVATKTAAVATSAEGAQLRRVAGGGGGLLHAVAVRSPARSPEAMRELSNIISGTAAHQGAAASTGIATVQASRYFASTEMLHCKCLASSRESITVFKNAYMNLFYCYIARISR
jgi:hypothetical protein